jgi:hypothetical protein
MDRANAPVMVLSSRKIRCHDMLRFQPPGHFEPACADAHILPKINRLRRRQNLWAQAKKDRS